MRYVQINSFYNGSTGTVMKNLHKRLTQEGHDSYIFWGRRHATINEHEQCCATRLGYLSHGVKTRLFGKAGFYSRGDTRKLLKQLDSIDPDVVHLHNIHGYYINIEMLFEWLARHRCQVKWTLHDCWAFTGHCAHFAYVKCAQWKSHCAYENPCYQLDAYPKTISKASVSWNFEQKKRLFTMLPPERMTLVTPSQWLADLLKESFLKDYSVVVHHNEIDTSIFKPTMGDFRERSGLKDRFIVLGVASPWTDRKGLPDFVHLAQRLDGRFAVVLVGLNRKQIRSFIDASKLPVVTDEAISRGVISADEIINERASDRMCCGDDRSSVLDYAARGCAVLALERTESQKDLAKIYSAADVFFNPTREDNYPTVNLEAEACGTPVITYDTGGCRETVNLPESLVLGEC